jgi:hypothetical protein
VMVASQVVTVEIASGPGDGTAVRLSESSFSVGTSDEADVKLAPGNDVPACIRFKYELEKGRLSLKADADFEHEGAKTRALSKVEPPTLIRVGSTDLFLLGVE